MEKLKLQQFMKESDARVEEGVARVWKMQQDALHNMKKSQITATKMQSEQQLKEVGLSHKIDVEQANAMTAAQKVLAENTLRNLKEAQDDGEKE
jgi:hypothetical protein